MVASREQTDEMRIKQMGHLFGGFSVFSMKEMHEIHCAAMEIVGSNGLKVCHEGLLSMAGAAGIKVSKDQQKIFLDPAEILETIRQMNGAATAEITETGAQRSSLQRRVVKDIRDTHIGSNHGFVVVRQDGEWQMRAVTCADLLDFIKLRRALGCSEEGPGMIPQDVPAEVSAIHAAALYAKYAKGDISTLDCKDTSDIDWITRVMQAAGRWKSDREFRTYACAKSPLCLTGRDADIVYRQARDGYLTRIYGVPIMGGTSPCTLAADMALRLAETLGYFTFSRLITPGPNNTFAVGGMGAAVLEMEPRKARLVTASPRARAYRIGWTQMQGEFYKAPGIDSSLELSTDAAEPGAQSCMEKSMTATASLLGGVYTDSDEDIFGGAGLGTVVSNLALSPEQAVLDKEMVSYLNKLLEGVTVDEDALAVDLIKDVGSEGDFMSTEHTVRRARTEYWHSALLHNGPFDAWIAEGRKGPFDHARQVVSDAIGVDLPLLISEDAAKEVDNVVEDAERALL